MFFTPIQVADAPLDAPLEPRTLRKSMARRDALPLEAVRDLLGIVRAMYAAAKRDGAPEERLASWFRSGSSCATRWILLDALSRTRTGTAQRGREPRKPASGLALS
jgi:hypothetical protein